MDSKSGEGGFSPEGKEKIPDFKAIFDQRLEAISAIPEAEQEDWGSWYEGLGIKKLKREVPALVFRPIQTEVDLDLWIEDPKNIEDSSQPHDELRSELGALLERDSDTIRDREVGALLLEDSQGKRYLLVDEIRASGIQHDLQHNQDRQTALLDLLRKYDIQKVAGRFHRIRREGDSTSGGGETEVLIDEDLLGKRREELFYINLARQYNMTTSQYLRFRIRTKSAFKAGIAVKYDDIAREIIEDDKEN